MENLNAEQVKKALECCYMQGLEHTENCPECPYTDLYPNCTEYLGKDVKRFPTADVVEIRHGHWIKHIEKPDWLEDDVEVFYNCSECGTSHWSISPPYCPNCGAKMDGERREK